MDSSKYVQRRIALSTQKDTLLGMFVESSLAHSATLVGPEGAEAIRQEVFGKRSLVSFFRYPVADLLKLADLSVIRGKQEATYSEAMQEFGRAAARYFLDSPVGKTMMLLAGGNAHRLMGSAPSGYKAVTSFGERSYEKTSANSAILRFEHDLLGPGWHAGVFQQALKMVCDITARTTVEVKDDSGSAFVLSVDW